MRSVDDGIESMRSKVIVTIMFVEFGVFAIYTVLVEFVKSIILLFAFKTVYSQEYFVAQDVLRVFFNIFFAIILVTVLILMLLSASAWKSETFGDEYKSTYDWVRCFLLFKNTLTRLSKSW
mgnify:CR=1 FL=1